MFFATSISVPFVLCMFVVVLFLVSASASSTTFVPENFK